MDSSVTSCLKINATDFAEIIGKNTRHVLPNGVKNARDMFCQARSHCICTV
jgi:hypothetical protein